MQSELIPIAIGSRRHRPSARTVFVAALAVVGLLATSAAAQQATAPQRQLAPGVLTTIPPDFAAEETVSTHDVVELHSDPALRWTPEYLSASRTLHGMSADVKFRRDIWCLEFSFKPLRMIEVDIPQAGGGIQRTRVWYLVYRVRNTGEVLTPVEADNAVFTAEITQGEPVRFLPQFVLEAKDRLPTGERVSLAYLDRVIPAAVDAISQRETPGHRLLNSVEMAARPIPVSDERVDRSVWGVATWTDVDPRIDFFAIYVGGLTNAHQWQDAPGVFQPGDPPGRGRTFTRKTLQLNFWRPGDEIIQHERQFRFGVAPSMADLYDVPDGVAHRWLYR